MFRLLRKPIYRYVFHFENMCQPVLLECMRYSMANGHQLYVIVSTQNCRNDESFSFHYFVGSLCILLSSGNSEFTFPLLPNWSVRHRHRHSNVPFVRFSLVGIIFGMDSLYIVQEHWWCDRKTQSFLFAKYLKCILYIKRHMHNIRYVYDQSLSILTVFNLPIYRSTRLERNLRQSNL